MPGLNLLTSEQPESSNFTLLFFLTGLAIATYAIAKLAESNNQLEYDSRIAHRLSRVLTYIVHLLHTRSGGLEITAENALIAIGPHRTGMDAIVVASKVKGTAPRFFATDSFKAIRGVDSLMRTFNVIPVEANATRGDGRSANAKALEEASKTLSERGCVAIFPQGNFAKLGQEPPKIYSGAAQLALRNNVPIHVIRLDGFWCLQNPFLPVFIRNHVFYRVVLSAFFHMNNIVPTLCCIIDFHLKPENKSLSEEQKIEEINAQLYAYYRHTGELNPKQIGHIKNEISNKLHLMIWKNRLEQDKLGKQLSQLKKEEATLEEPTLASMRNG